MDSSESQNEEREVLQSIYEGDPNFKEINPACYQYKYGGEENEQKAFLVEISWPKDYPEVLPVINLDLFLNNTLPKSLKEKIKSDILQQAEDLLGTPMTYSLLDWTRENAQDIIQRIPENLQKVLRLMFVRFEGTIHDKMYSKFRFQYYEVIEKI